MAENSTSRGVEEALSGLTKRLREDEKSILDAVRAAAHDWIQSTIPSYPSTMSQNRRWAYLRSLDISGGEYYLFSILGLGPYSNRVSNALEQSKALLQKMDVGEITAYMSECMTHGLEVTNYRYEKALVKRAAGTQSTSRCSKTTLIGIYRTVNGKLERVP